MQFYHSSSSVIYGGVVLKEQVTITGEELVTLSYDELMHKYQWLLEAPNVQTCEDPFTGTVKVRSRVPSITTLKGP